MAMCVHHATQLREDYPRQVGVGERMCMQPCLLPAVCLSFSQSFLFSAKVLCSVCCKQKRKANCLLLASAPDISVTQPSQHIYLSGHFHTQCLFPEPSVKHGYMFLFACKHLKSKDQLEYGLRRLVQEGIYAISISCCLKEIFKWDWLKESLETRKSR